MASFGLTPEGLSTATLTDIVEQLNEAFRNIYGRNLPLGAKTAMGQVIAAFAERPAELWEVLRAVYAAMDPDEAEGDFLEMLCAITGTVRLGARQGTATLTCAGTTGTSLAAGRVASADVVGTRFATDDDATLAAVSAWVALATYAVGDRVKNGGRVYHCRTAGAAAASGGPTTTAADITDGTVHWRYLGAGDGAADVAATAEETGPLPALAFTLNTIETPVAGWSSVTNLEDAEEGRDVETDEDLRLRRELELLGQSRGTVKAIRTRLLEDGSALGVTLVYVFMNTSELTDGAGLPPRSVECLVVGATDDEVAELVLENVGAGMYTYGNTTVEVEDVENGHQVFEVNFSRPTDRDVYVVADVVKDPDEFPEDGDAQLLAALLAYEPKLIPGKDVVANALRATLFAVAGVLEVTNLFIGLAPSPASEATIVNALRQRGALDSSRVTINTSDGVP